MHSCSSAPSRVTQKSLAVLADLIVLTLSFIPVSFFYIHLYSTTVAARTDYCGYCGLFYRQPGRPNGRTETAAVPSTYVLADCNNSTPPVSGPGT